MTDWLPGLEDERVRLMQYTKVWMTQCRPARKNYDEMHLIRSASQIKDVDLEGQVCWRAVQPTFRQKVKSTKYIPPNVKERTEYNFYVVLC